MILDKQRTDATFPRSPLDRSTRWELFQFAQRNGVKEIVHDMPATLMRKMLQERGLTNIQTPYRQLGARGQRPDRQCVNQPSNEKAVEVNAAADLARQWAQQQALKPTQEMRDAPSKPLPPSKPKRLVERPRSEINQLRDECKRLSIKMERRDNMTTLKAKIAAHGK